ncbi:unnamed protein product [Prunus brigantina]
MVKGHRLVQLGMLNILGNVMLGAWDLRLLPVTLQGAVVMLELNVLGMKMVVFLRYLGDASAEALQLCLEISICWREVKVRGLYRISMWDFGQAAVVVTRVLEIRFGSLRASAIGSLGRCLAPWKSVFLRQGRRRVYLGASRFEVGYAWLIMV